MPGPFSQSPMPIWPRDVKGIIYPHVFVHVEGEEKMLTVSTEDGNEQSKSNEAEIEQVVKLLFISNQITTPKCPSLACWLSKVAYITIHL